MRIAGQRFAARSLALLIGLCPGSGFGQTADTLPLSLTPITPTPGTTSGPTSGGVAALPATPIPRPVSPAIAVLPATGTVRVGISRDELARSLAGEDALARPWTITPSIGVTEEWTDNVAGVSGTTAGRGAGGSDVITLITPGLLATGRTARLQGSLSYTPEVALYARHGDDNRVAHNLDGQLLAALVPQTVFLDLRAYAGLQSTTGLAGPPGVAGSTTFSRRDATQTVGFSASPYVLHRFGPWGTGEIGGSIARSVQDAVKGSTVQVGPLGLDTAATNQNVTRYGGHAAFVTGEAFGRYNGTALASLSTESGGGVLRGARRDGVTTDHGYAITRTVTALGTIGWEDIRYGGSNPLRVNDVVWDVGVRLVPNAQSTLVLRYGHHDGFNSLTVDAALQPSARTRLYLRYSAGLTTSGEELLNALATTDVDALGAPVDHATGAPILAADNFFGVQTDLYRLHRVSLDAVWLRDRDVFSAGLDGEDRKLVSAGDLAAAPGGFTGAGVFGSNKGLYGSLTWAHDLRPDLTSTLYLQYGVRRFSGPPASTQHLLVASAALAYALSPSLSGRLEYDVSRTTGNTAVLSGDNGNSTQNLVLLSLAKSF